MRRPRAILTSSQREAMLAFAAAIYGIALAIGLLPTWDRPAPPGQLPGYMTSTGLDARAASHFILSLIILGIGTPIVLRPLIRRLSAADTELWARVWALTGFFISLWASTLVRPIAWAVLPGLVAVTSAVACRKVRLDFSRHDLILIPVFAATYIALCDLTTFDLVTSVTTAFALTLLARVGVTFVRRAGRIPPAAAFAVSPVALFLQSHVFGRSERQAAWLHLAIALLTPFALRFFIADKPITRRSIAVFIACVAYPLALFGYVGAASLESAQGGHHVDMFEDAFHLVPGAEMLRGELPFRDIATPHGLIADGLLDFALMKFHGPPSVATVQRGRGTIGAIGLLAVYGMLCAATGSPDIAMAGVFAGFPYALGSIIVRAIPTMSSLALLMGALRRRSMRLLSAAAAVAVLGVFTSVDYGLYACLVVAIFTFTFHDRWRAVGWAAAGAAAMFIFFAIPLAILGILGDFFTFTTFELRELGPIYALPPIELPAVLQKVPPMFISAFMEMRGLLHLSYAVTIVGLGAVIATPSLRPRSRRRFALPLMAIAAMTLTLGASYAERHHTYFFFTAFPLGVACSWRLIRRRRGMAAAAGWALAALLVIVGDTSGHLAISAWVRRAHGPLSDTLVHVGLPRARGGLFQVTDAKRIDSVRRYLEQRLGPNETFFDFTNSSIYYFLLDRDCPIRELEVAFYEDDAAQREVIRRLELNRNVRAVLVPPPADPRALDGVQNSVRAPLVWKYIQDHFEPDFEEEGIIFWRRKT